MTDTVPPKPHADASLLALAFAKTVRDRRGIALADSDVEQIAVAAVCGFIEGGGLSYRARRSAKRAAAQWLAAGCLIAASDAELVLPEGLRHG